jgi:hypothetical protein
VVGVDDLDRLARGLAAEILDCHAHRFDRAFARGRRQDAGLLLSLKQPHVLDSDRCLIRERGDQLDLFVSECLHFRAR